jgi:hypothetical protein
MRIHKSLLLLLVSLCALSPALARAADVAFFPVETTTLQPADAAAIGELLAQAYAATSRQAVLAPSRTEAALATAGAHAEAARTLGVREYVRANAVGVGRKVVIHATRHRADGQQLFQAKMTADSIEDVTTVSERLALALHQRADDEAVRTHQNVTLAEGRAKNRVWTEKVFGVKTGVHLPFAKNAEYSPLVSLGFDGRLEHERFFLEFGAALLIPTELEDDSSDCWDSSDPACDSSKDNRGRVGGLAAEIGGSYFLTQGNTALYVGGGLLPRLTVVNDSAMVSVYGQVGVMLPREASTRFYLDLRVAQAVIKSHLDNGWERHPTELALHAGIGW